MSFVVEDNLVPAEVQRKFSEISSNSGSITSKSKEIYSRK
jgi:hypothetical protein